MRIWIGLSRTLLPFVQTYQDRQGAPRTDLLSRSTECVLGCWSARWIEQRDRDVESFEHGTKCRFIVIDVLHDVSDPLMVLNVGREHEHDGFARFSSLPFPCDQCFLDVTEFLHEFLLRLWRAHDRQCIFLAENARLLGVFHDLHVIPSSHDTAWCNSRI